MMDSYAWMDRGCQQLASRLQSSKPAEWQTDTMRNHQTSTVGASYQDRTSNTGAHSPQTNQSLDWQARTTSCRQTAAGVYNPNYWRTNGNFQTENPYFMAGDGAQQCVPPNYFQSSIAQGPTNVGVFQNSTAWSAYTTATNSFQHGQWSHCDTSSFTASNLNHRPNNTQDRFSSSVSSLGCFSAARQSHRNITTNSSSSQQAFSRRQRTQPNQALVSYSGLCNASSTPRTDKLPLNSLDETREKMIAKIAEDLRNSVSDALDSHPATYCGNQYVSQSQVRGSESNHHAQPAGNHPYNSQSAPLCSAQSPPESTNRQAAKRSKAATANIRDSYGSLVQTLRDASHIENSAPMLTAMLRETSNSGSIHLSPGCVGTRAVAVVQPLLQESCQQDTRQNSPPDMMNQLTEHTGLDELSCSNTQDFRKRAIGSPERSKQTASDKSITRVSSVSNEPLLDSTLKQNQPTEPEPAADIQDHQHVSPAPQEPAADVPESQRGDKDNTVNPTDPPNSAVELSSIPTIQYTVSMMKSIICELNMENMDHIRKSSSCSSASKLIQMFWGGNPRAFLSCLKEKMFSKMLSEAQEFCSEHITGDTVIVSKEDWEAVEGHYILKSDEVYTEPPYQPFWLNDNEKLDDIEKEFGLPWPLRHCPRTLESDIHLDQAETVNGIPEQILREVSNKVQALTEQELVDRRGEKSPCAEKTTPIKPTVSTESSDPLSSLKIKVLPREEALQIFEQAVMSSKSQPEREESSSAEAKLQEVINITLRDLDEEGSTLSPIEQVCCMERFKTIIYGPSTALSTCKCQSEKDPQKELKHNEVYVISSDRTSDSTEEDHPAKGEDSCNIQTIIYIETVDFLENGETNSCQEAIKQPSPTLVIEDMEDGLLACGNTAPLQEDTDAPGTSPGPIQLSEADPRSLSQAVDDEESSSETEAMLSLKTVEPAGLHTSPQAVGSLNSSAKPLIQDAVSEKKERLADRIVNKFPSLKYGTAKLALFGSSKYAQCSTVVKRSQVSASGAESSTISGPPEVLSVSLSPLKRKFCEAVPAEEPSVKLRIYERWRKSLPPTQIRCKKFKSQKFLSLSAVRRKKNDRTGSLKQPLFPEKRIYDVKMIKRREKLLSNGLKHRKGKNKRGRRRHAEDHTDKPQQESIILKFSVLPETFSFRDGPHGTESTMAPVPGLTEDAGKKCSTTTITSEKGTWNKHSEKKYRPLSRDTASVFQEFQKKYKKLLKQE